MAKETKNAQVNIRMRPSIKSVAEKMAEADDRSLANFLETLIVDEQKRRTKPKGKATSP